MLGFEPTTFGTWVSSHNHKTRAPALILTLLIVVKKCGPSVLGRLLSLDVKNLNSWECKLEWSKLRSFLLEFEQHNWPKLKAFAFSYILQSMAKFQFCLCGIVNLFLNCRFHWFGRTNLKLQSYWNERIDQKRLTNYRFSSLMSNMNAFLKWDSSLCWRKQHIISVCIRNLLSHPFATLF